MINQIGYIIVVLVVILALDLIGTIRNYFMIRENRKLMEENSKKISKNKKGIVKNTKSIKDV